MRVDEVEIIVVEVKKVRWKKQGAEVSVGVYMAVPPTRQQSRSLEVREDGKHGECCGVRSR
jgi:hypothetical protein